MTTTPPNTPSTRWKVVPNAPKRPLWKKDDLGTGKDRSENLLKTGKYADCTFLVGSEKFQKTFQAHALLLAVASPVMEAMFFGPLKEEGTVTITDISPKIFKYLLQFVYTGQVGAISQKGAMSLYHAADKYLISQLKEKCIPFIGRKTEMKNIWKVHEFYMLTKEEKLLPYMMPIFSNHANAILDMKEFEDVNFHVLSLILDQDSLRIHSEVPLFNAILRWARNECLRHILSPTKENIRAVLGDAITKIRFLTMDPEEFMNGPANSGILTREEIDCVLRGIRCPNKALSLPTICKERRPRICGARP